MYKFAANFSMLVLFSFGCTSCATKNQQPMTPTTPVLSTAEQYKLRQQRGRELSKAAQLTRMKEIAKRSGSKIDGNNQQHSLVPEPSKQGVIPVPIRGDLNLPELEVRGEDEVASLTRSFNRMQRSLKSAVKMLDESGV